MNDAIIYRPYKSQAWVLYFLIFLEIAAFTAFGYCLAFWGIRAVVCIVIGMVCIWLTKVLYNSLNIAVLLEQEGVRIVGGGYGNYRYIPWKELPYAYYARSYKGHLFIVLSSQALSPQEAKKFANRAANSSKVCVDHAVVIYMDVLQDVSQIKETINDHVLHIEV